jgi:hypothetical protein
MAKFAENRKLYGSNSRPKKVGATPVAEVLDIVAQNSGHFITVRKSEMREPVTGRIVPRNLVSVTDSMTEDEKAMYIQLCQLAAQA